MIELKKKMFGFLPYPDEYKMPVITGVVVGLMISGILGIIKGSTRIFIENTFRNNADEKPDETTNEEEVHIEYK